MFISELLDHNVNNLVRSSGTRARHQYKNPKVGSTPFGVVLWTRYSFPRIAYGVIHVQSLPGLAKWRRFSINNISNGVFDVNCRK